MHHYWADLFCMHKYTHAAISTQRLCNGYDGGLVLVPMCLVCASVLCGCAGDVDYIINIEKGSYCSQTHCNNRNIMFLHDEQSCRSSGDCVCGHRREFYSLVADHLMYTTSQPMRVGMYQYNIAARREKRNRTCKNSAARQILRKYVQE